MISIYPNKPGQTWNLFLRTGRTLTLALALIYGAYGAPNMKLGDVFPFGRLIGPKGPLVLDSSAHTVVYFYPKDQTPGCTIEAHEFQALKPEFEKARIRVVGVSADDSASHRAFCEKEGLAFELATDPNLVVGKELGNANGERHLRTTFVLDHDAHVVRIYSEVKPKGHAVAVLKDIESLKPVKTP
jgi:thioredoxin-dependent peroxiredoxin